MNTQTLRKTIAGTLCLLAPMALAAQTCSSTGKDGVYHPTKSGVFDPVALNLNTAGDNIFHFSSITIPDGVTIRMPAHLLRSQRPVVFLVSGPISIHGVLDLSGTSGNAGGLPWERTASEPGPGGYPGGAGGRPGGKAQPGAGPGGGIPTTGGNGCSGSYAWQSAGPSCSLVPPYGNPMLSPLVGGSGGSGANASGGASAGPTGGAGGGAIRICSNVSIDLSYTGRIYATGGNGGTVGGVTAGAGSGGSIHLQAPTVTARLEFIKAFGGSQARLGAASDGRIRIDANAVSAGQTVPPALFGRFLTGPYGGVPLPASPTVTVVSVNGITKKTDGVPLTIQPQNSYSPPDLLILPPPSGNVVIVIKTTGIPNGTKATFYIATDTSVTPGATDIVTTATISANAATLNVPLPAGVDRLFVRAVY